MTAPRRPPLNLRLFDLPHAMGENSALQAAVGLSLEQEAMEGLLVLNVLREDDVFRCRCLPNTGNGHQQRERRPDATRLTRTTSRLSNSESLE
jgi:hypothetical protein